MIKWTVLVVAVVTAAGLAYYHYQGQEVLRAAIEQRLAQPYRDLAVSVKSARLVGKEGIEIRGIHIVDPRLVGPASELVYIDETFIHCSTNIADLLHEQLDVSAVIVRHPRVRCTRLADGQWSTAALWPLPKLGDAEPNVTIEDGALEIVDARPGGPSAPLTLRDLQLTISAAREPSDGAVPGQKPPLHVQGSLAADHFQRLELDAAVDVDQEKWSCRGRVQNLRVGTELWDALPLGLFARPELLDSIQGDTNLSFAVASGESKHAPWKYSIIGQFANGQVRMAELPEPLTHVQAGFQCDNRQLTVDNLEAMFGQARVQLSVTKYGLTAHSPMSVTATANNLQLDERLPAALPKVLQPVWDVVSPRGVVSAELKLEFDGHDWTPDVTVRCTDVSVELDRLPYRVHHLTGIVRFARDELHVNLRSPAGEGRLRIEGEFQNPGPDYTGKLLVESEELIPIDKRLVDALEPEAQRIVRPLNAQGSLSFVSRLDRRSASAEPSRHVIIQLDNCSIEYDKFPYPIRQIRGTLEMNDRHWSFRDLEGRNDSGYITCAGRWLPAEPDGGQLTLDFVGSDIPLEDELRDALTPEVKRVWMGVRPRGSIDHLTVGLHYRTWDERLSVDVRAQKWPQAQNVEGRTISVDPEWFPYRLDRLTGTLHYRDGHLELRSLHAAHGAVALSAEGRCDVFDDGRWQLRFDKLSADRLTTDNDLITSLPPQLGRAIDRLNLRGPIALSGAVQFDGHGSDPAGLVTNWDLILDLENGSLGCGIRFEHIHGGVRLTGSSQGDQFQSRGELAIDSLTWQGLQFTQIRGPLFLDRTQLLCGAWAARQRSPTDQPRRVSAQLFGGTFESDARLAFDDEGRFDIDSQLIAADLAKLATEAMSRQHQLSGKLFGTLQLTGNCQGTHSLKGRGSARLTEADIYELPLMVALLKILTVRRPDKTAFTDSDIDYRIEGDHVYLDRIDFTGDTISLKGKGSVGLDRYIEGMEFYTLIGPDVLRPPLLGAVLGEASRQILVIRVAGTLDDPQTSQDAFPALNETLQRLFPEMAARRQERPESRLPSPLNILQGGLLHPWR